MHISISECAPRSRRVQIMCENEKLTETSRDVIRMLGLKDGDEIEIEGLIEDMARVEEGAAKKRTLHLLNYRDRTREEIVSRLLDEGFSNETVTSLADRFEDVGLIDDSRFAEQYTRSKLFANWGRSKMLREMKNKGVAEELAHSVLNEICPEQGEVDRALPTAPRRGRCR